MVSDYELRKAKGRAGGAHVTKSNQKKSASLEKLVHDCFPEENPPLTEVAALARNEILRLRIEREKFSGALVSPENLCFEAGNIFLRQAIGFQPGALLELETLWRKFADLIAEVDCDSAARFTWPVFLFPDDNWNDDIVKTYSVGNAAFIWPPDDLEWIKLTLNMLLTWHKKIPSRRARKV
ncbi:MAG: hypothetical protein WBN22_05145 [Verrucomicrobiia bacterium]